MTEDDPTDEISEIEERIEALAEVAERCRKFVLASRVAIASGVALLLVAMFGLFGAGQSATLGSITLMLGGFVSLGSNISTLRQTDAAINAAETLRSDLIGKIDLRVVRGVPVKLMQGVSHLPVENSAPVAKCCRLRPPSQSRSNKVFKAQASERPGNQGS